MAAVAPWRAALGAVFIAMLCALPGPGAAPARAAAPSPPSFATLAGSTLSAVTYVARGRGMPGGGEIGRFMFQAYLRPDGTALVRVWDEARDRYTRPEERRWTLAGRRLCVGLPRLGPTIVCADVHVWGPRIAGVGTEPYVMLDGDLEPGNALAAGR
jgi:hypothetical protein